MKTTNKDLYNYHKELIGINGSVLKILLNGRINDFYKNNGIRINTLIEKMEQMQRNYFQFEGEKLKFETIEDKKVFKLLEGKTQEDFDKEIIELMNQETTIVI